MSAATTGRKGNRFSTPTSDQAAARVAELGHATLNAFWAAHVGATNEQLALLLDVSPKWVHRNRPGRRGQGEDWSERDLAYLRATGRSVTVAEQASHLGRTPNAIRRMRGRLGLTAPAPNGPARATHDQCICGKVKLVSSQQCVGCANRERNALRFRPPTIERSERARPVAPTPAVAPPPTTTPAAIERASQGRLLTLEEEQALGHLLRDDAHKADALDLLVRKNEGLIWAAVNRYRSTGYEEADLYQEGAAGLIYGLGKWDPDRGLKLSTYVTNWIRQGIQRATVDRGAVGAGIRLPVHMTERIRLVAKAERELLAELGREPTDAEIAVRLGLPLERITSAREAQRIAATTSLDAPPPGLDEDRQGSHEAIPDPHTDTEGAVLARLDREEIFGWLERLPARDRQLITLRYGLDGGGPRTLEQVSGHLNLTRERVRQLEATALERLRRIARPHATAAD